MGLEERRLRARADEIMDYLKLGAVADRPVGDLPFGTQKRVELGRALAMKPRLLLLDEMVSGMNQEETEDIARFGEGKRAKTVDRGIGRQLAFTDLREEIAETGFVHAVRAARTSFMLPERSPARSRVM